MFCRGIRESPLPTSPRWSTRARVLLPVGLRKDQVLSTGWFFDTPSWWIADNRSQAWHEPPTRTPGGLRASNHHRTVYRWWRSPRVTSNELSLDPIKALESGGCILDSWNSTREGFTQEISQFSILSRLLLLSCTTRWFSTDQMGKDLPWTRSSINTPHQIQGPANRFTLKRGASDAGHVTPNALHWASDDTLTTNCTLSDRASDAPSVGPVALSGVRVNLHPPWVCDRMLPSESDASVRCPGLLQTSPGMGLDAPWWVRCEHPVTKVTACGLGGGDGRSEEWTGEWRRMLLFPLLCRASDLGFGGPAKCPKLVVNGPTSHSISSTDR